MRPETKREIFALLSVMRESGIEELRMEIAGFHFHAIKNSPSKPPGPAVGSAEDPSSRKELRAIVAPRLGFFRRPKMLETALFAGPGQKVEEKDVVGLIHVLENTYPVHSGVSGIIQQVCAEDGKLVEFNQPLFLVAEKREKA
jgi:biotin carboxyl carrier protein